MSASSSPESYLGTLKKKLELVWKTGTGVVSAARKKTPYLYGVKVTNII